MTAALAAAALLVLAGCTSAGEAPDDAAPASPSASPVTPEDVVRTATMTYGTATIEIGVHPLVRVGDDVVLTLEVSADDPDEQVELGPVFAASQYWSTDWVDARQYDGVRLVDLAGDAVAAPAFDADGRTVQVEVTTPRGPLADDPSPDPSTPEHVQIAYGDPGTDEVAVYLPKAGLVEDVPVVDGEVPDVGADEPIDLAAVAEAPVTPMESYSYDTTAQTRTQEQADRVTIALASDVLFDSSSARLDQKAQQVIEDAAARIEEREPGTVAVVGHTDDVDTDAFNQKLSERRAKAVADRLGDLVDPADYPLEASGKGETQPVADGTSEEDRAANRRVELTIETPVEERATPAESTLPEFDGPVATGAEGVDHEDGGITPTHITAPRARVVDDHLVVTVDILRTDDEVDSASGLGNLGVGGTGAPEYFTTLKTTGGLAVMTGSVATLPAFHRTAEDGAAFPLADVRTNGRIDGGQVRTVEMVYPRGLAVGDTVTLQLLGYDGFRLTDIPVER